MELRKENDNYGGSYYVAWQEQAGARAEFVIEELSEIEGFVCSYRDEPFFMTAKTGKTVDKLPKETQWLGIKHTDGSYSVYFSVAFETYRTSFYGKGNKLWLVAVTGDETVTGKEFCAYYKISGSSFYELVQTAAKSLRENYATCRLRTEKPAPAFMDYFGWCTWDSFYDLVKEEDVAAGLENFKQGGFVPKLVILDDGWQTTDDNELSRGQWKLSDYRANGKFGFGLKETIEKAKESFGVEYFLVWHAVLGYWGGISKTAEQMKKYNVVLSEAVHTNELKET